MAKNHTLCGSKGSRKYDVVLSGSKNLKRVYPFGSISAENDTRLGSKNGENYTLSSGTYPVPKTSKCPPPGIQGLLYRNMKQMYLKSSYCIKLKSGFLNPMASNIGLKQVGMSFKSSFVQHFY